MSSTTSRSTGDVTPTPPVFSYAQAAKGRTPLAAPAATPNKATSGVSTPAKAANSTTNTPPSGSERGDNSVNGSNDVSNKMEQSADSTSFEAKPATSIKSISRPRTPSLGTASTSKEGQDDEFILVGGPSSEVTREKTIHDVNATEKVPEATEGRKGKKGKKQKNAEKEAAEKGKEEVKPEVLVPAPLPTVNFWQQRKDEAAKTKPVSLASQLSQPPPENPTPHDTPKSPENKKRGKSINAEDNSGSAPNGGIKDSPGTTRAKRGNDGTSKAKEDQPNKRSGPRGGRVGDKEEKPLATQLPPPVEDSMSWPTPETALEEEKRKAQEKLEKEEKEENSSNKPRPKEKWVPVPYVPSVAFNTPLPPRGGRGRGGARGGRTEGGRSSHVLGTTGDKAQNTATATVAPGESDKRLSRGDAPRAASLPPNSTKRPSSDPSTARDSRKPSVVASTEKPRGETNKSEINAGGDIRQTQGDHGPEFNGDHQAQRGDHSRGSNSEHTQGATQDTNTQSRSAADRRSEPNMRGFEQPNFGKDSNSARERTDGRSERGERGGRGGAFRTRGGGGNHNYQNGQHANHVFTNGHGPQQQNGFLVRQSSGPYSPPLQPPPFNNQYPIQASRGRGSSRAQSIPNSGTMYGRFTPNGGPTSQHMPPLQTSNTMYDQYPMQSLSAVPFNPYVDHLSVLSMVSMQLEYYFSIDNLCKDVFLRKHMDSQGFVFLAFIAGFKRIQALTQDFELLRYACQDSPMIDLIRGEDGADRLRRKDGWEKWVLGMEERDESVRNAGPAYHQRPHSTPRSQQMGSMIMPESHVMSPPAFSPNGTESNFRAFGNSISAVPVVNGNGYHPETPLSAAVPDFAPGLLPLNGSTDPLEAETTFNDEEVANLTLVFAPPRRNDESKPKTPYHSSSSRTFSNGSIDGRSIAEEMNEDNRQGRALTNGSRAAETSPDTLRSRSPFSPISPTSSNSSNAPPVMWVKGQRQQAPISEHNSQESYTSFRARALTHRENSSPGETHSDMKLLYEFWSHFLCRNFNLTMYTEFRKYAFEDEQLNAKSGKKNLISYYDEILNSKKKTIPETLARHYIELVMGEDPSNRPAFEKLRAAWRNGALDMKSRKRIDNFVNPQLREELESAPKYKAAELA